EDGIRASHVTGVQTCALPISVALRGDEMLGVGVSELHERGHGRCSFEWGHCGPRVGNPNILANPCTPALGVGGWVRLRLVSRLRSEERRVGKEWRARCCTQHD